MSKPGFWPRLSATKDRSCRVLIGLDGLGCGVWRIVRAATGSIRSKRLDSDAPLRKRLHLERLVPTQASVVEVVLDLSRLKVTLTELMHEAD
jgi:hypothetical protein